MIKRILLFAVIAFVIPAVAVAKVFLVSVGVADYPGEEDDLTFPAKDARLITSLYKANTDVQYLELFDENATKTQIINAMNSIFPQAGEDDIVLFFYSGHGYPGGFCAYDGLLGYREIQKSMAMSRCKNKIILADACYSGKMRTDSNAAKSEKEDEDINVMLFLSSRSDETSCEIRFMKNGLFTTYLYRGLRGKADFNRDKIVTAKEIFRYVRDNVVKLSNDEQHPVMWGNFSDEMPVVSWL